MTDANEIAVAPPIDTETCPPTPTPDIAPLIFLAHQIASSRITHPYEFRIKQLRGIDFLLTENWDALSTAIAMDLGQGPMYAEIFELSGLRDRLRHTMKHLKKWMKTKHIPTPFPLNMGFPVHSELTPYPRGVALVISPWNFPIQLSIGHVVESIAAGNVCILKPSERSVHTTSLLTKLLTNGKYVDPNVVMVVNGGAEQATELLKHRVDVISYTGGGEVGKIVALAAAKHLTPVMLELGGKSPVVITKNAHIPSAAQRIAWGKIAGNAGQFCVSPDYVLVDDSVKEQFTNELSAALDKMYPVSSYSASSPTNETKNKYGDVGTMISVEHAERVVSLLDSSCNIIYGGKHHDIQQRFVAPTVVEATAESKIMQHEIFGPLLAVISVPDLDAAIQFVNKNFTSKGKHPLALYIFSRSKQEQQKIMNAIPSGTCAINDVIKQPGNYLLPFGGVGTSGIGSFYGKYGFDFYSHYRGALVGNNFSASPYDPALWMTFAPHDENKLFMFRTFAKLPSLLKKISPTVKLSLLLGIGLFCFHHPNVLDTVLEINLKTIFRWISQIVK